MRTFILAGILFLGLAIGETAESQETKLNVRLISGNVYMIDNSVAGEFGRGNSAVLVGDDGLLLVDADALPDPRTIITGLQGMFNKPIRYVVETACGGLLALSKSIDSIVAVDKARRRVEQKKCWRGYPLVLPTVTFEGEMRLYLDGEEVRVLGLPTGKTDGDAMVYFKNANVVATGDTFVSSTLPLYTIFEGGNMLGLAEELRRIVASVPADAKVIPGHGPLASIGEVRKASVALDGIRDAVAAQVDKGKTLDQIRGMNLLEPWKDQIGNNGASIPAYLQSFYDRLRGPPEPDFQLSPDPEKNR